MHTYIYFTLFSLFNKFGKFHCILAYSEFRGWTRVGHASSLSTYLYAVCAEQTQHDHRVFKSSVALTMTLWIAPMGVHTAVYVAFLLVGPLLGLDTQMSPGSDRAARGPRGSGPRTFRGTVREKFPAAGGASALELQVRDHGWAGACLLVIGRRKGVLGALRQPPRLLLMLLVMLFVTTCFRALRCGAAVVASDLGF